MPVVNTEGNPHAPSIKGYSEKKLFIAFFAVMVALIVEGSLSQVADIVRDLIVSFWGVVLFVIIFLVYAVGQFFILETIKAKNRESSSSQSSMRTIEYVITVVQYALTGIIAIVVLQILFSTQYDRNLLLATNTISYSAAVFLTVILTWKLLSWYKTGKLGMRQRLTYL